MMILYFCVSIVGKILKSTSKLNDILAQNCVKDKPVPIMGWHPSMSHSLEFLLIFSTAVFWFFLLLLLSCFLLILTYYNLGLTQNMFNIEYYSLRNLFFTICSCLNQILFLEVASSERSKHFHVSANAFSYRNPQLKLVMKVDSDHQYLLS